MQHLTVGGSKGRLFSKNLKIDSPSPAIKGLIFATEQIRNWEHWRQLKKSPEYVCIYVSVCVCVCIYIYIYIYIRFFLMKTIAPSMELPKISLEPFIAGNL